ncbi:hypothetical protein [Hydrogenimonas sp.]
MKNYRRMALAALACAGLSLSAAQTVPVQQQIDEIEQAPAAERYKLMNGFKERLAAMQKGERERVLQELRAQFARMERTLQRMPRMERVIDQQQATQILHMEGVERMGQRQGVEQFIHNNPVFQPGNPGDIQPPQVPNPSTSPVSVPSAQGGHETPVATLPFGYSR